MQLIYSALRNPDELISLRHPKDNSEIQLRYQAYTEACRKHRDYISDIQKYFPGWMPPLDQQIDHSS